MNGFRCRTSAGIQSAQSKHVFENGAMPISRRTDNKGEHHVEDIGCRARCDRFGRRPGFRAKQRNRPRQSSFSAADDAKRAGCIDRSGKACRQIDHSSKAWRQVDQVGKARPKAPRQPCSQALRTEEVERPDASNTAYEVRHGACGRRRDVRLAALSASKFACDPEYATPQRLRTEARIVRTGLWLSTGSSRSIRKPDLQHDLKDAERLVQKIIRSQVDPGSIMNE